MVNKRREKALEASGALAEVQKPQEDGMARDKQEVAWEPGEADVEQALRELGATTPPAQETDPADAFVVLLDRWDTWETARAGLEQDYALRNELRLERNEIARQYATAKFRRNAIEARLLSVLQRMKEGEREAVLTKSYVLNLPQITKVVVCKKELAQRLRAQLTKMA